ncbi:glycine zipper 2TM domain-containing protein [Rhizorhabdus sp.]|uniref:glycine zipper 2TM domain-containing protein n=1 Tax=Rhizorhabdus sp. TaxID=1968843 RepID=UPI001B5B595D|nr:glycine zipper 2TM domain-containing protein [Rhizorhabdus sp.]MBP8233578.1 glycine zipper 2TM domain-containing protein [Rhizorhabdus sp.]
MRARLLVSIYILVCLGAPAAAIEIAPATDKPLTSLPDDWLEKDLNGPKAAPTPDAAAETKAEVAEASGSSAGVATAPDCKKPSGTTGLILGAVAGGLLGNVIDGGDRRTLGTLIGAGGGALLGREVEQRSAKCP